MDVGILPLAPAAGPRNLKHRDRRRNRWNEGSLVEKVQVRNLVMGQVRILKRGEIYRPDERLSSQDSRKKLAVEYTDDAMSQVRVQDLKHRNAGFYGSTFTYSPPPSSVPLPLNLLKKRTSTLHIEAAVST